LTRDTKILSLQNENNWAIKSYTLPWTSETYLHNGLSREEKASCPQATAAPEENICKNFDNVQQ